MIFPLVILLGYSFTFLDQLSNFTDFHSQSLSDNADTHVWRLEHVPNPTTQTKSSRVGKRRRPWIQQTSIPQGLEKSTGINRQKCLSYCLKVRAKLNDTPKKVHSSSFMGTVAVNGTECLRYEFPHMAALGVRISNSPDTKESEEVISWHHCGGSLISEDYVLTAAHCVTRDLVKVRLGALTINNKLEAEDINIDIIHLHPDYNGVDVYNDIALLKLERKVVFNVEGIRAACLWYEEEYPEMLHLEATGWGRTGFVDPFSNVLQKVVLYPRSNEECSNVLGKDKYIPQSILPTQICAGVENYQADTCTGDSGGPLQVENILLRERPHHSKCGMAIVGITSFGKWCGEKNLPGVYTRVAPYVPWIESIVWLGAGDIKQDMEVHWVTSLPDKKVVEAEPAVSTIASLYDLRQSGPPYVNRVIS